MIIEPLKWKSFKMASSGILYIYKILFLKGPLLGITSNDFYEDILPNYGWAICDGVFLILYNILTDDTVR